MSKAQITPPLLMWLNGLLSIDKRVKLFLDRLKGSRAQGLKGSRAQGLKGFKGSKAACLSASPVIFAKLLYLMSLAGCFPNGFSGRQFCCVSRKFGNGFKITGINQFFRCHPRAANAHNIGQFQPIGGVILRNTTCRAKFYLGKR